MWLDPILPFINDTEVNLRGILSYCVEAKVYGIIFFGFGLTLREGNREYFYEQLDKYFPSLKEKYIKIYGNSYEISSFNSKKLYKILKEECLKNNIILDNDKLFTYLQEFPNSYNQLTLFD